MKVKKWIIVLLLLTAITTSWFGYDFYNKIFAININEGNEPYELFIPSNANFDKVVDILTNSGKVKDINTFIWVANRMNYDANVSSGRYLIEPNLTNKELVTLLRSGAQVPVRVTINKFRTKQTLASFIASKLEADSVSIVNMLNNPIYLSQYGWTVDNVMSVFLHNTYEFYWNTSAEIFFEKMNKEYQRFWNEERKAKAEKVGLTPQQVIVLASIVEEETNVKTEKPIIAGVYLNRLKKGMKLQADPTVRFALNDFRIKRIKFVHLAVESRFNTYLYEGLPPGPICTPTPVSIESVLKPSTHNYLYFCAKEDFSGTHNFATTHAEHVQNAMKYRSALDSKAEIDSTLIL
jgi:UPF0755 protein